MYHRSFIPLYVFALLISLVSSLRAQTTNRNKPRTSLQNASKTIPSKIGYAYKIIAKREAGKETTIGGVNIKEFDDNWLSQFVLAENGDIIFRAYTNRGPALFKNNQALAYPGKTFPGSTVSDADRFYPRVLAVSRGGDVLFLVMNRYHKKNGSDYLGPVIVLNDRVVCEPWAVLDPDDHTDRIVNLADPQAGFTESGQYAMGIMYRKYTPRLDEKGHQFKDPAGKPIFDTHATLKYLVGGSIVDERPEIVEQRLDARMHVGPTGIPIKPLFQRIFGIDVDSLADIGPHHLSVASGLLVLRNHTGQIAMMLGTLKNGAWLPVLRGASGGQAVVLATPTASTLKITKIRLGIPNLDTDFSGDKIYKRVVRQNIYVQGSGMGNVTLHWFDNNKKRGTISQFIDLSTQGGWIMLDNGADGERVLHGVLATGQHTLKVVVDNPTSSATSEEEISITSFIPSVNGWRFENKEPKYRIPPTLSEPDYLLNKENYYDKNIIGLCDGMSLSARQYFLQARSLPPYDTPKQAKEISNTLYKYEIANSVGADSWFIKHDLSRIKPAIDFPLNAIVYKEKIKFEAEGIRDQLKAGHPCVIELFPLMDANEGNTFTNIYDKIYHVFRGGHSVVGTAAIFSSDIFDAEKNKEVNQMYLFSIYNPNYAGDNKRYVLSLDKGERVPQFQFLPAVRDNYVMWALSTFPNDLLPSISK